MKNKNNLKGILIALFVVITLTTSAIAFSFKDITLKFVQISDSHISERQNTSYKMLASSQLLLTDAIKQVNAMYGVDFVVFTGDMVDEPIAQYWEDFFEIISKSKYPVMFTYGNHDRAYGKPEYLSGDEISELVKKYNKNYPIDKPYYAITPKADYRMIVLDLTQGGVSTSNGRISSEQLSFLDRELSNNQDKVILIFQHFPVVEPFESQSHNIVNANEYLNVINKYDMPIAIFSGHYHSTKIIQDGNILHVSTPSLVTFPNAFRTVNITNYKDRTIFDFYFNQTTLTNVQEESKANTISYATFLGNQKDQTNTITIMKKKHNSHKKRKQKSEK